MDAETPAVPRLDATEARVLGCLIEKAATTPETYPLTVNAAQAAANQKTAREPLMALDPGAVHHALRSLERQGLAKQTFSARAERYEHRAGEALGITRPQQALLALLLLRGAQTVSELFARSERLSRFDDADGVRHQLERLAQRGLVLRVPRGPGQREDRYVHLLCGPVDVGALPAATPDAGAERGDAGLAARVDALEAELAALRERLATLEAALAPPAPTATGPSAD